MPPSSLIPASNVTHVSTASRTRRQMNIETSYLRWAKYFAVFAGLSGFLIGLPLAQSGNLLV